MLNRDEIWKRILSYAKSSQGRLLPLLNPNKKSPFTITEVSDKYIRIDKLSIKMTKQMFLGVCDFLRSKGGWVRIGASRINTKPETIEGFIKRKFFNDNLNGLSTATWFSAILVYSDIGVEFNNKVRGQKLRLKQ